MKTNLKRIVDQLVEYPVITSVVVTDLAILIFHRPPAIVSIIMLGILVAGSMFFGEKLQLFAQFGNKPADAQPSQETEAATEAESPTETQSH